MFMDWHTSVSPAQGKWGRKARCFILGYVSKSSTKEVGQESPVFRVILCYIVRCE